MLKLNPLHYDFKLCIKTQLWPELGIGSQVKNIINIPHAQKSLEAFKVKNNYVQNYIILMLSR